MQSTPPVDGQLSPSDFPRTFSAAFRVTKDSITPGFVVHSRFAIDLELELSAATKKLESAITALHKIKSIRVGSRESALAWKTLQEIE